MSVSTVAELEAAVIAGDTTITPAQIEKARQAESFALLKKQSDERAAQQAEAQERQDAIAVLRADYDQFMTTDLTPLRDQYQEAVAFVGDLRQQIEDREAAQHELTTRATQLGLRKAAIGGGNDTAPFRDDAERWRTHRVTSKMLDHLIEEAKRGYPTGSGRPITHALHTDERREQIESLRSAHDKRELGQQHLDALISAQQEQD